MRRMIILVVAVLPLSGCSHSQWSSVELATQGASWLNPVATVLHMTASAGRAMTDPEDELLEKVKQRDDERKKGSSPEQSQPDRPQTELK